MTVLLFKCDRCGIIYNLQEKDMYFWQGQDEGDVCDTCHEKEEKE
jgi:hypothetical protein